MSDKKIQALLVGHLLKHGQIELKLPDGVVLEIGVTQENEDGDIVPVDDYCWVVASKGGRTSSLDSFNISLKFEDDENILVFDDRYIGHEGAAVRRLNVV